MQMKISVFSRVRFLGSSEPPKNCHVHQSLGRMSSGLWAAPSRSVAAYEYGMRLGICQRSVTMTLKFDALSAIARSRKYRTDQISVTTSTSTMVPMLVSAVRNRFRRTFLTMIRQYFASIDSAENMTLH